MPKRLPQVFEPLKDILAVDVEPELVAVFWGGLDLDIPADVLRNDIAD